MTEQEAQAEAEKRWGDEAKAYEWEEGDCEVGYWVKFSGATFEEAFKAADEAEK